VFDVLVLEASGVSDPTLAIGSLEKKYGKVRAPSLHTAPRTVPAVRR
jgi:hypothetical protein